MTAKEYLREARESIKRHQRNIQLKKDSIAESYAIMTNTAAPALDLEKVRSSSSNDRFPNILAHIEKTEREIDQVAADIFATQSQIVPLIEALPKFEQRRIMTLYYIHAKSWENIFAIVPYSERHVYRVHGDALLFIDKNLSVQCQ